ncbi:hypothetical protein PG994_012898 [Apiospora phragmitis]|uniref:Retrotransposon gag domain-containing protein n=1 Tax=Apiospora phragmitis TaxID=2905665 RepID=A0ABR1T737_9PEZI
MNWPKATGSHGLTCHLGATQRFRDGNPNRAGGANPNDREAPDPNVSAKQFAQAFANLFRAAPVVNALKAFTTMTTEMALDQRRHRGADDWKLRKVYYRNVWNFLDSVKENIGNNEYRLEMFLADFRQLLRGAALTWYNTLGDEQKLKMLRIQHNCVPKVS